MVTFLGGAAGTCARHHTQRRLRCVYCSLPIHALYPPCLGCGCPSHDECLAEWHAAGETECPAGDECRCVDEASSGQIESWTALRAAMADKARKDEMAATAAGARASKGLLGEHRRKPALARSRGDAGEEDAATGEETAGGVSREGWEVPVKPPPRPSPLAGGQLSAVRMTLGSRLRPSVLRRPSTNSVPRK